MTRVTPAQARAMYDLVAAQGCPVTGPKPDCVPFLYPDDGCYARAHEMARLMIEKGVSPQKAWCYADMTVRTANSPVCEVGWWYHVAPILSVMTDSGDVETAVDPALLSGPAPIEEWVSRMVGAASHRLEKTGADIYFRSVDGSTELDANYELTRKKLREFRARLELRIIQDAPPGPPYTCRP